MKLPLSLLQEFITIHEPIERIVDALTSLGIEVDGVLNQTPHFVNVVAGKVISAKKHPQADRLQVAEVTDGHEVFQVVCAATNCREGLMTAFAKVGAVLGQGTASALLIKPATLRGVPSYGMLCSGKELGFPEDSPGILELSEDVPVGTDLARLFLEPILELSFTPNLGHVASAIGIARELSAYFDLPLKSPPCSFKTALSSSTSDFVTAKIIDPDLVPRYSLYYLDNITVGPSPTALRVLLEKAGMRSINNVVDITNLVMLEFGQPLHAYDYDLLDGQILKATPLKIAEIFLGLDGEPRQIKEGTLVIQDGKKTVALAGIMGGKNSAISSNTKRVVLESAQFDSSSIRKVAKKLSLRTESALRFEKKTDPEETVRALERACHLLELYATASIAKEPLVNSSTLFAKKELTCRLSEIERILGIRLSLDEVEQLFRRADLQPKTALDKVHVSIPSYRHDLCSEVDLIEEVAKLYGLNHFVLKTPTYSTTLLSHCPLFMLEREMKQFLVKQGLTEWITCDLISPPLASLLHEKTLPLSSRIEVLHAKSIDTSILRQSLLPNFLEVIRHNLDHKNPNLAAFELGKCYFRQEDTFKESTTLSIALTGSRSALSWKEKEVECDFFDLKGIAEAFLEFLSITDASYLPSSHGNFHPYRQVELKVQEELIGVLGEVHPETLEKLNIKQRVYFLECNLETLSKLQHKRPRFSPLPQFPSSERDWTVNTDRKISIGKILRNVNKIHYPLLEKCFLLDIYQHPSLGETRQNVSLRFIYRDPERTLSFEEIEKAHGLIIRDLDELFKETAGSHSS